MRSVAQTFSYDAWNRLVQIQSGGTTFVTYAYDGQNWRVTKLYAGGTWDYYFTSSWQLIEQQIDTTLDRQYVWGLLGTDNLVLRDRFGIFSGFYAFADSLGSITAIATNDGAVLERYHYNAFGPPLFLNYFWSPISYSAYDWQTLFAGYLYDGETAFYHVRNRYLHPNLGRWLSRDPIGYGGGLNLYAYVGNNPTNRVDPMGLGVVPDEYGNVLSTCIKQYSCMSDGSSQVTGCLCTCPPGYQFGNGDVMNSPEPDFDGNCFGGYCVPYPKKQPSRVPIVSPAPDSSSYCENNPNLCAGGAALGLGLIAIGAILLAPETGGGSLAVLPAL